MLNLRFYGGYDRLTDGSASRALQDLTGGIVQSFTLSTQDRYLTYQVLNSAVPRSSLIVASILPVISTSGLTPCNYASNNFVCLIHSLEIDAS